MRACATARRRAARRASGAAHREGGQGVRPARLGWTVGTPPYRYPVITWERAAENAAAPGGHQPFDEIDFVIVDVETTGWSPDEARITEIGAVRFRAGHQLGQFSSLVNPGRAIPERVVTLTGISDAMVAAAPPLDQVLPAFLAFAHDGVLTAHNAPFDVGFLRAACQACDLPWPDFPVVDTVELARLVLSEDEVPNCKLSTLAAFFGARTAPRHRALADALATADVLRGLLPRLPAAGVSTLAEMIAVSAAARRRPPRWLRMVRALAGGGSRRRAGDLRPARRTVRYRRWLGIGARGGRCGHRDRPGESRRGAHPGNGGGDSPDPAGQ
jgi:DNA polymerase III epsilon subunit family exonuclease